MTQAYAPTPSPAPIRAASAADCDRLAAVLAEIAALPPALFMYEGHAAVRLIDTADAAECGICPEAGADGIADADATICHAGAESGYVYRTPVCLTHLADEVGYQFAHRHEPVWLEVPLAVVLPRPVPCRCDATRGQSCRWCDGVAAEDGIGDAAWNAAVTDARITVAEMADGRWTA